MSEIVMYQTPDNLTQIEVRFEEDTVWLSQQQMAALFQQTKQNISLHINNCFKEKELVKESVVKESLTTATDGKNYNVSYYNLDVIISVGYRVKSPRGTQFRQWATPRLRDYLVKGYAVNRKRLEERNLEIRELKDGITLLNDIATFVNPGTLDMTSLSQRDKARAIMPLYMQTLDPSVTSVSDADWYREHNTNVIDAQVFKLMDKAGIASSMTLTAKDWASGWSPTKIAAAQDQFSRNYLFAGSAMYDYKITEAALLSKLYTGGVVGEAPFIGGFTVPVFMPGFSAYNQGPVDLLAGNKEYQYYKDLMKYKVGEAGAMIINTGYPRISMDTRTALNDAALRFWDMRKKGFDSTAWTVTSWLDDVYLKLRSQ